MSYCAIVTFEDGMPNDIVEYKNAWGGAARIWNSLFNKYLKDPYVQYDTWLSYGTKGDRRLWDLYKREDLSMFERAVLVSTFDHAIIFMKNFQQFANHLREFANHYPVDNSVCHLLSWAGFIESCGAEAIGFYGTSVCQNLWFDWDDKTEESIPYNLNSRNDHFEVYELLSKV